MKARQFITDCEGPISLNDNAYELTKHFIPNGDRFFAQISKYDDILADIVKRPGYKAGDTLKLILPFLKAYGASNGAIKEYSAKNIIIVPGADATLEYIGSRMPSFIISTSYEPYLNALCDYIGFDRKHVYCTKLDLDKYIIESHEIIRLKEIHKEIDSLAKLEIPADVGDFDGLPDEVKEAVKRLDGFFWEDILSMKSGEMLKEINPVGGIEKANAILHSLKTTGNDLQDVMYIGDSITDAHALDMVKKGGGVAVSFNGNRYALNKAEIACISDHTIVISIMAEIFSTGGKEMVMALAGGWSFDSIKRHSLNRMLIDQLLHIYPESLPKVGVIKEDNIDRLTIESEFFRKIMRGKEAGTLG
ncbi:MAG: HAD hydrolase family protein [Thermodesulfobacteriota bacterium]